MFDHCTLALQTQVNRMRHSADSSEDGAPAHVEMLAIGRSEIDTTHESTNQDVHSITYTALVT